LPAVHADLAAAIEVVEIDELLREGVKVRCRRLAVQGQGRIAIADRQIAEDLVIGTVLFDDVNDVLDVLSQKGVAEDALIEATVREKVKALVTRFPIYQS